MEKIRFAIMCNSTKFPYWEVECIRNLLSLKEVELALLIIDDEPKKNLKKILNIKSFLFLAYHHLFINPKTKAYKEVDLTDLLNQIPKIKCKVVKKGKFSEYFKDEDITKLKNYNLDFILRFGFNIIRGKILTTPKHGVWSFHHDDEQKYRGAPPSFWEIYKNDPISGAVLQKLTDKLDSGIILQKGYFKTIKHSYGKNRDNVFLGTLDWPKKVCIDIINKNKINQEPSTSQAPIYTRPTNSQMIIFLSKLFYNTLTEIYNYLFKHEYWNIGIVNKPINKFLKEMEKMQEESYKTAQKFTWEIIVDDLEKVYLE